MNTIRECILGVLNSKKGRGFTSSQITDNVVRDYSKHSCKKTVYNSVCSELTKLARENLVKRKRVYGLNVSYVYYV